MQEKNRDKRISQINSLRKTLRENLLQAGETLPKLAQLIENKNAGVEFAIHGSCITFPPYRFNPTEGTLHITVHLVEKDADIYYPGSTNSITVADIDNGQLRLAPWNSYGSQGQDYRRISQYKGPNVLPDISEEEVKKRFFSLQKDIERIFSP